MRTDDLIAQLSGGLEPVTRGALTRTVSFALGVGLVLSVTVMLSVLGLRHDFHQAMVSFGMWMKMIYTFAIAAFGLWLVGRAGRPGAGMRRPALLLLLPVAAILLLTGMQMAAPGADARALVMGHSSDVCATNIILVAAPTLAASFWALRRMAPTRLVLAGAIAGLFAGAAGAFVYAFHCTEGSAPFVAVWYSLGILLTTGIGAFLGRWALRW